MDHRADEQAPSGRQEDYVVRSQEIQQICTAVKENGMKTRDQIAENDGAETRTQPSEDGEEQEKGGLGGPDEQEQNFDVFPKLHGAVSLPRQAATTRSRYPTVAPSAPPRSGPAGPRRYLHFNGIGEPGGKG
jgi:hypothetical protein